MKKLVVFALAILLLCGMPEVTQAYYEEYTGYQSMNYGDYYNFEFDMWYTGTGNTDAGLKLTTDAVGAFGEYSAGFINLAFYSTDNQKEYAQVKLDAYGDYFGYYNLGTYEFNATSGSPYYYLTVNLPENVLNGLDNEGWGNVRIVASYIYGNDFAITKVGLNVSTVPEPTSLLLLGLGLLGIAGWRRK